MSETHHDDLEPGVPPGVRLDRGPDSLVGIPYKALTAQQSWALKVWRFGQSRCTDCDYHQHTAAHCPNNEKVLSIRKERNQCLNCGSHTHFENCPEIERLKKVVGPFPGVDEWLPK